MSNGAGMSNGIWQAGGLDVARRRTFCYTGRLSYGWGVIMSATIELLDLVRAAHGNCSDYRCSQLLGVSRSVASSWRVGVATMNAANAHRAALLAGVDPVVWVVRIEAERAATPDQAAAWQSVLTRLKGAATLAAFTLLIIALPNKALAAQLTDYANRVNIHYANYRRRWQRIGETLRGVLCHA